MSESPLHNNLTTWQGDPSFERVVFSGLNGEFFAKALQLQTKYLKTVGSRKVQFDSALAQWFYFRGKLGLPKLYAYPQTEERESDGDWKWTALFEDHEELTFRVDENNNAIDPADEYGEPMKTIWQFAYWEMVKKEVLRVLTP